MEKIRRKFSKGVPVEQRPKTNFDCVREERVELKGISEFEMLERLSKE